MITIEPFVARLLAVLLLLVTTHDDPRPVLAGR